MDSEINNVSIVTFKLEPQRQYVKYGLPVNWFGPPRLLIAEEDIDPYEDYSLTESERFYHQIAINRGLLVGLRSLASNKVPYLPVAESRRFREISWGYEDVQAIDNVVSNHIEDMQPISVVVAVYNKQYSGHIYVWISPTDPKLCLMIGIRNRVDNVFILGSRDYLPNVSLYLLEGCRKYALQQGSTRLAVIYPLSVMIKIITVLGFQQGRIRDIETSMSPISPIPVPEYSRRTLDAYYNDNLNVSFINYE